jgi:hypothetical protein
MPTPRPLGVRRANVNEERFVRAANNLPALRPFVSCGGLGFGALQRAPHPHSPRPGWPRATSQAGTVRRNIFPHTIFYNTPGAPPVGRHSSIIMSAGGLT